MNCTKWITPISSTVIIVIIFVVWPRVGFVLPIQYILWIVTSSDSARLPLVPLVLIKFHCRHHVLITFFYRALLQILSTYSLQFALMVYTVWISCGTHLSHVFWKRLCFPDTSYSENVELISRAQQIVRAKCYQQTFGDFNDLVRNHYFVTLSTKTQIITFAWE